MNIDMLKDKETEKKLFETISDVMNGIPVIGSKRKLIKEEDDFEVDNIPQIDDIATENRRDFFMNHKLYHSGSMAGLVEKMKKDSYFPDVWLVGERGDVTNITTEVMSTGGITESVLTEASEKSLQSKYIRKIAKAKDPRKPWVILSKTKKILGSFSTKGEAIKAFPKLVKSNMKESVISIPKRTHPVKKEVLTDSVKLIDWSTLPQHSSNPNLTEWVEFTKTKPTGKIIKDDTDFLVVEFNDQYSAVRLPKSGRNTLFEDVGNEDKENVETELKYLASLANHDFTSEERTLITQAQEFAKAGDYKRSLKALGDLDGIMKKDGGPAPIQAEEVSIPTKGKDYQSCGQCGSLTKSLVDGKPVCQKCWLGTQAQKSVKEDTGSVSSTWDLWGVDIVGGDEDSGFKTGDPYLVAKNIVVNKEMPSDQEVTQALKDGDYIAPYAELTVDGDEDNITVTNKQDGSPLFTLKRVEDEAEQPITEDAVPVAGQKNTFKAVLKKDREYNEYQVRYYINGKFYDPWTIFTDDKQDAVNTMNMVQQDIDSGKYDGWAFNEAGEFEAPAIDESMNEETLTEDDEVAVAAKTKPVKTKKPNGVVLWEGPSPYDGSPLVCVAIFHSDNEKTGDMVQTYIIRSDMTPVTAVTQGHDEANCGSCPFRSSKSGGKSLCYVNVAQGPQVVFKSWKRGIYPAYDPALHLDLFRGRAVRLGSYGDPAMVPLEVFKPLLDVSNGHTGYTHCWMYKFAQPYKPYLMASTESIESYEKAKQMGWRCFRAIAAGEKLLPNEKMCPNETNGVNCVNCKACHGAKKTGTRDITITAHGRKGNAERFTDLSNSGELAKAPGAVVDTGVTGTTTEPGSPKGKLGLKIYKEGLDEAVRGVRKIYTTVTIGDPIRVSQIPEDATLVNEEETSYIRDYFDDDNVDEYDSFFVTIKNGEYDEVWGIYGYVPTSDQEAYPITLSYDRE